MSTLNVANISDDQSTLTGANENPDDKLHFNKTVDTKFVTNGCAKAWCRITIAAAVESSLNISSVKDVSTGNREFNFSNSYSSTTSHSDNISSFYGGSNGSGAFFGTVDMSTPSASKTKCGHYQQGNAVSRPMYYNSHGDLA